MNKETEKIYSQYCKIYINHSLQYADYLSGSANNDLCTLLQSEYKKDLKEVVRRERERLKIMNKFMKMKLRADKRILRCRKASVDYDFTALIDERMKTATKEYLAEIFNSEQANKCETCANFAKLENDACGCAAYNLVFNSDELRKQFCTCYCTAYRLLVDEPDEETTENDKIVADNDDTTEETPPPVEQKQDKDAVDDTPMCCKECSAFLDGVDGCYCQKYMKYLDNADVDNVCCCENDDFLDDDDEA